MKYAACIKSRVNFFAVYHHCYRNICVKLLRKLKSSTVVLKSGKLLCQLSVKRNTCDRDIQLKCIGHACSKVPF